MPDALQKAFQKAQAALEGRPEPEDRPEDTPTQDGEGDASGEPAKGEETQPQDDKPTQKEPEKEQQKEPAGEKRTVTLELEDGKTVEVDEEYFRQCAKAGALLGGDVNAAQDFLALDTITRRNPKLGEAIRFLAEHPETAELVLKAKEGAPKSQEGKDGEDPRDKAIRELQARIEQLEKGGKPGSQETPEQKFQGQVTALASKYPSLRGMNPATLQEAVLARMHLSGEPLPLAILRIAERETASQEGGSDDPQDRRARAKRLQGAGASNSAGVTSLKPESRPSADDLMSGRLLDKAKKALGL